MKCRVIDFSHRLVAPHPRPLSFGARTHAQNWRSVLRASVASFRCSWRRRGRPPIRKVGNFILSNHACKSICRHCTRALRSRMHRALISSGTNLLHIFNHIQSAFSINTPLHPNINRISLSSMIHTICLAVCITATSRQSWVRPRDDCRR
jgi:hypothetical protein